MLFNISPNIIDNRHGILFKMFSELDYKFTSIRIFPSNARKTAIIVWRVTKDLEGAAFYIYKKVDGGATYELLNTTPVYDTTFVDTTFYVMNKGLEPFYRILAIKDGVEVDSPEVSLYNNIVGRKAFGIAQNIIRSKYLLAAKGDGIPVLYYPAIRTGPHSDNIDDITKQRTKAYCDGDPDNGSYYKNGFYPPYFTFIRLLEPKTIRTDRLDVGYVDSNTPVTEFLNFPPVRYRDLVIDVEQDKRYLVGKSIRCDKLKGVIPLSYTAPLDLQQTNDPVYNVPIPDNYEELLQNYTKWILR